MTFLVLAGSASAYTITQFDADVWSDQAQTQHENRAGSHPDTGTFRFAFSAPTSQTDFPGRIRVDLPAGLEALPDDFPRCSDAQLTASTCDPGAQVGVQDFVVYTPGPSTARIELPIYNMTLGDGQASRFAYRIPALAGNPARNSEVFGSIRDTGDFGQWFYTDVSSPVARINQTFWGIPHDTRYDTGPAPGAGQAGTTAIGRGQTCVTAPATTPANRTCFQGATDLQTNDSTPFLNTPTFCGNALTTTATTTPAGGGANVARSSVTAVGAQDCSAVPFDGTAAFAPTGPTRDAPYGFGVSLAIPQATTFAQRAQSQVKRVTATLPPGVTINPAAGNTIQACTDAQFHAGSEATSPIECPAASKVGTASTVSPLTQGALTGSAYVGQPLPGDRYRLFVDFTGRGVSIRIKGSINADENTGQLVATFDNQPQLPFDTLDLSLDGGPNGILAAPNDCSVQSGNVAFGPWSGTADVNRAQTIQAVGCGGSLFSPGFASTAGTLKAGAYSTLTASIDRPDGQQFLRGVQVKLAKGALAKIKGQTQCSSAGASAGVCPAASRVGTAYTQSGAGGSPLPLNGPVYFTGPYKGAPYGLVTVVRAIAGPYDLGNVVVRQAINVDPRTAQVIVDSDPLPQVVGGIPLRLRTLKLDVNKGKFGLNPTYCGPAASRGTFSSAQGTTSTRLSSLTLSGCKSLKFKPSLSLALRGKGRFGDGDHPGILTRLRGLGAHGTSNVRRVQVILPKSLALDPNNAQSLCEYKDSLLTDPKCPKGSVVGYAKARTPILEKTLAGKVYFAKRVRTNSAGRQIRTLPQLVVALRGNGVKLNLIGTTAVSKDRLVTSFSTVPDAPVSAFDLRIDGGKNGILVANTSVCKASKRTRVGIRGQNGDLVKSAKSLGVSCGSSKKSSSKKKS